MIKTLFSIVPINDGYKYLCKDKDNNHFLKHKADDELDYTLLFVFEKFANKYIKKNLDVNEYKVEPICIEKN